MKRTFGIAEAVFDCAYLCVGVAIGVFLLATAGPSRVRLVAGVAALVLAGGDSFHLVPRVMSIVSSKPEEYAEAMGRGKQITSITMTLFYVLLWWICIGLAPNATSGDWTRIIMSLAAVRIVLCLIPQNEWTSARPPVLWGIIRNIPFLIMGIIVAARFSSLGGVAPGASLMWLAIAISFACYLPVVLWVDKKPWLGALMLPKTCAYVWILVMCLSL